MQKYTFGIFGREYQLYSLRNKCEKILKNEISLYAAESEKYDFAFDYCDTPPALSALLVGYFIIFVQGVPLPDITLLCRECEYRVERYGPYALTELKGYRLEFGEINILGVDTEYADTKDGRIAYFENLLEVDKSVLPGLLVLPSAELKTKILAVTGGEDDIRLYGNADFDMLYAAAKILRNKGILKSKIRVKYNDDTLIFTYENGIIKIGILPKVMK